MSVEINKLFGAVRAALDGRDERINGIKALEGIAVQFNIRRVEYDTRTDTIAEKDEAIRDLVGALKPFAELFYCGIETCECQDCQAYKTLNKHTKLIEDLTNDN